MRERDREMGLLQRTNQVLLHCFKKPSVSTRQARDAGFTVCKICNSETFITFFQELFWKEKELPDQKQEVEEEVLKALEKAKNIGDFYMEEFMKFLKTLTTNKAPGPDRIPGEAIKSSLSSACRQLKSSNILGFLLFPHLKGSL